MLNRIQRELHADQRLISIVAPAKPEEVNDLFQQEQIEYPVLLGTRDVLDRYGISVFPTNYVVDADGHLTSHTVGLSTTLGLRARMGCAGR